MFILVITDTMIWGITLFLSGYLMRFVGLNRGQTHDEVFLYIGWVGIIIGTGIFLIGCIENPNLIVQAGMS
jgi:hypothetical protein